MVFLEKVKMARLTKYYLIIGPVYLTEVLVFYILSELLNNVYILNFFIRGIFVISLSLVLKNIVFPSVKNFYFKFYTLCFLNPFFSSLFLAIIMSNIPVNLICSKLLADIVVSVLFYIVLLKM